MKKIVFLLFSLLSIHSFGQFANNWQVGNGIGINFSGSTPSLTASSITGHPDNSSAISDASGNLLFYTTGVNVWNKNHVIMPNGTGLQGSYTGGQCALIVPIPCNPNRYVIFHTTLFSNPGYLSYTVVDMSLNGGLGDVVTTQKNISLGTGWTEKLCAYYNPAGNFYWLLTHKWGNDQFVAFKIDATSIATTSVVTPIGSNHTCGTLGGAHDAMGQLTISPDGSTVANALTCQDKYELFQFNLATGVLSNSIAIPGNTGNAWATAFSPNSKKLYTNTIFTGDIFQYDLTSYNASSVVSSKTNVYSTGVGGYNFGYMELAADGKIYVPRPNTNFFSVIGSPNNSAATSGFNFNGISLGSGTAQWGTSRIAYNIPTSVTVTPTFSLTVFSNSATCNGSANGSAAVFASPSASYLYTWTPGNYTTSVVNNLSAGIYSVHVSDGACSSLTTTVSVTQPSPISIFIDPLQICLGNPGTLNPMVSGGTPAYTYSWSHGANTLGTVVSPSVTSNFTLYVTDANGCTSNALTTVTVDICNGINEYDKISSGILLYPNPASDIVKIKSKTTYSHVIITNLIGQKIKTVYTNDGLITISDLTQGVYFIEVFDKNKLIGNAKLIKE
ncbi:MAG: T9SS type A sorting domain-containing protein [Bacteroidetes bacterium]|nr:T9SS type A sorting domain-containing protein [Bacteroidota bacterium]